MWKTIFFDPLYNLLMWLISIVPYGSVGLAVIVLTILVKLALSPLAFKSTKSQLLQKKLQPKVAELRKEYPDQQEQAKKLMELYKEHKTSPFAGCLLIFIQIPIIIALYRVFLVGLEIIPERFYSFVTQPDQLNVLFAGIDLAERSILLAVLAGLTQFVQLQLSPLMRNTKKENPEGEKSTEEETDDKPDSSQQMMAVSQMMQKQMKFIMPIMIGFVAMAVPGAVALYWIVNNLFTMAQERVIARKVAREDATVAEATV